MNDNIYCNADIYYIDTETISGEEVPTNAAIKALLELLGNNLDNYVTELIREEIHETSIFGLDMYDLKNYLIELLQITEDLSAWLKKQAMAGNGYDIVGSIGYRYGTNLRPIDKTDKLPRSYDEGLKVVRIDQFGQVYSINV